MATTRHFRYLRCRTEQGVLLITITEPELHGDGFTEAFAEELLAALSRSGTHKVVLDFQRVTFITSMVFAALFQLRHTILTSGGRLVLCGLSPQIAEVFQVARLTASAASYPAPFEAQPDRATALTSLQGRLPTPLQPPMGS
jgi:anti-anti-sigma factor